jgi:hypothetical protein
MCTVCVLYVYEDKILEVTMEIKKKKKKFCLRHSNHVNGVGCGVEKNRVLRICVSAPTCRKSSN